MITAQSCQISVIYRSADKENNGQILLFSLPKTNHTNGYYSTEQEG